MTDRPCRRFRGDSPARAALWGSRTAGVAGAVRRASDAVRRASRGACGEPGTGRRYGRRYGMARTQALASTMALWNPPKPLPTLSTASIVCSRAVIGT